MVSPQEGWNHIRRETQKWIDDYRASLNAVQGYYLTGNRERIPVEDVVYEIIEIDTNESDEDDELKEKFKEYT